MAIQLDYPPGATPLDADELASLIPGHITTQGELNEWEQLNIVQGENWAQRQLGRRKEILNEGFLRQLHCLSPNTLTSNTKSKSCQRQTLTQIYSHLY